jgi:hypothetical protein
MHNGNSTRVEVTAHGHKEDRSEEGSGEETGGEETRQEAGESPGEKAGGEKGCAQEEKQRRETQTKRCVHEGDDPYRHPGRSDRR